MEETLRAFLNCQFVFSPREAAGLEPYVVFHDETSDPFLQKLLLSCRGEAGFRGVVRSAVEAVASGALVFLDGPTWQRVHREFHSTQEADKPRVLLYFANDPSGFWDFAQACGSGLSQIIADQGLSAEMSSTLGDFLEHWAGARAAGGRIVPSVKYYGREYARVIEANGAKVARVLAAFADEESRAAYTRILFGTSEQVLSHFAANVFGPQQYMDIVKIKPGDVIVNCGVGSGWELPYFLARLSGEGKIFNFDPNIVYPSTRYGGFIAAFGGMVQDHRIILGDKDGSINLPISQSNMVRSDSIARDIELEGYQTYDCRKLDSLWAQLSGERLDYLKMDVEGGEIYILKGAINTIRSLRPKLAVAVYHEIEHFWDYPCFLMENLQNYRFYLRQYGYSRFETLLYCVPAEDLESGSGEERLASSATPVEQAPLPDEAVLYFRDRKDAPRRMYCGDRRVLTRFSGRSWETGDFRHAPEIDADEIVGIIEEPERSTYFAKHAYDPKNVQLIAGTSSDGLEITWSAATGVSPHAACVVVGSADQVARVLAYDPEQRAARLFRLEGKSFCTEFDIVFDGMPVVGDFSEGVLRLQVMLENGRFLIERRFMMSGAVEDEQAAVLPGNLIGVATRRSYGSKSSGGQRLFAIQNDERLQLYSMGVGALKLLGDISWDRRFEVVGSVIR